MIGDAKKVSVLGVVELEGGNWPELWTFEKGKGRVFGSVLGHYTWTHEDPLYRILVLRGLSWAAGTETSRFDAIATRESAAR